MKLSNKILLSFFGFAFLYLNAIFVEFRVNGIPNVLNDDNSIAESINIPGVTFIVLDNVTRDVKIIESDQPRLEIRSLSGGVLSNLKYQISGDTLKLLGFALRDNTRVRISVFVGSKTLAGIAIHKSSVSIEGLKQDRLNIFGNDGRVWMSGNMITTIDANVSKHSSFGIVGPSVDSLLVNIEESEVNIHTAVGVLESTLENRASLHLDKVQVAQFKKDETSRLNINQ